MIESKSTTPMRTITKLLAVGAALVRAGRR